MEHCLQILVDNKPGVLARVVIQLARRSINIDCLAARNIAGCTRTVITIGFDADEYTADRLAKGIARLIDVIEVRSPGSNATRRPEPIELPQCLVDDWGKPWRPTNRLE